MSQWVPNKFQTGQQGYSNSMVYYLASMYEYVQLLQFRSIKYSSLIDFNKFS